MKTLFRPLGCAEGGESSFFIVGRESEIALSRASVNPERNSSVCDPHEAVSEIGLSELIPVAIFVDFV